MILLYAFLLSVFGLLTEFPWLGGLFSMVGCSVMVLIMGQQPGRRLMLALGMHHRPESHILQIVLITLIVAFAVGVTHHPELLVGVGLSLLLLPLGVVWRWWPYRSHHFFPNQAPSGSSQVLPSSLKVLGAWGLWASVCMWFAIDQGHPEFTHPHPLWGAGIAFFAVGYSGLWGVMWLLRLHRLRHSQQGHRLGLWLMHVHPERYRMIQRGLVLFLNNALRMSHWVWWLLPHIALVLALRWWCFPEPWSEAQRLVVLTALMLGVLVGVSCQKQCPGWLCSPWRFVWAPGLFLIFWYGVLWGVHVGLKEIVPLWDDQVGLWFNQVRTLSVNPLSQSTHLEAWLIATAVCLGLTGPMLGTALVRDWSGGTLRAYFSYLMKVALGCSVGVALALHLKAGPTVLMGLSLFWCWPWWLTLLRHQDYIYDHGLWASVIPQMPKVRPGAPDQWLVMVVLMVMYVHAGVGLFLLLLSMGVVVQVVLSWVVLAGTHRKVTEFLQQRNTPWCMESHTS